jgi:hypothetical protein
LAAVGIGILFAVLAVISQERYARGYASVGLLFVSFGLVILGVFAGIVTLAIGKFRTTFGLIASPIILLATFLLITFLVRVFNGE